MRQFIMLIVLVLSINFTPVFAQANDLIDAAKEGDLETVQSLIEQGADVNAIDNNGNTALMWASARGHTETVGFLIDKGADVNAVDNDGDTALKIAKSWLKYLTEDPDDADEHSVKISDLGKTIGILVANDAEVTAYEGGYPILENGEIPDSEFEDEITFDTSELCDLSATGFNYPPLLKKRTDGSALSELLNHLESTPYHEWNASNSHLTREGGDNSIKRSICELIENPETGDPNYPIDTRDRVAGYKALPIAKRTRFRCNEANGLLQYMKINFYTSGNYCDGRQNGDYKDSPHTCTRYPVKWWYAYATFFTISDIFRYSTEEISRWDYNFSIGKGFDKEVAVDAIREITNNLIGAKFGIVVEGGSTTKVETEDDYLYCK